MLRIQFSCQTLYKIGKYSLFCFQHIHESYASSTDFPLAALHCHNVKSNGEQLYFANTGGPTIYKTYCLQLFKHQLWRNRFIRLDNYRFVFNIGLNIGHAFNIKYNQRETRILVLTSMCLCGNFVELAYWALKSHLQSSLGFALLQRHIPHYTVYGQS